MANRAEDIVQYLEVRGGRVTSKDGRGLTQDMASELGFASLASVNAALVRLERSGRISRQVQGRRTFAVSLTNGKATNGKAPAQATRATKKAATRISRARNAPKSQRRPASPRGAVVAAAPGPDTSKLSEDFASLRSELEVLARRIQMLEARSAAPPPPRRWFGR